MRRDMELIRRIMAAVEEKTDLRPSSIVIEDVDSVVVGRHVEMLFRAGMLDGFESQAIGDTFARVQVTDLSWEGHDFIASLKNETVWSQLKQKLSPSELSSIPLSVMKDISIGVLKSYLAHKVGLN